jgi:Rrf2 family protein
MVELALNYGKGRTLLKDIARRQEISAGYLEHLIPSLKAAGLINAARGARGGYMLAKPPENITAKEIIELLEGDISLVDCVKSTVSCSRHKLCITRALWSEASKSLSQTLESYTLADLIKMSVQSDELLSAYSI